MTHQEVRARGSRRAAVLATALATILAVAGPLIPHAAPALPGPLGAVVAAFGPVLGAPAALAAGGIDVRTDAQYTVDPGAGLVRVSVDVTARNTRPNATSGGVTTRYFYEAVLLGIHEEATRVRASAGGRPLTVITSDAGGFRVAEVRLRRNLFYEQRTSFRLQYDLPSGAPRSASDIRVGSAFATFYVWAFGDSGTVRIEVPAGFSVAHESEGASLERAAGESGATSFFATVTDTEAWWAWVNATNRDGLTRDELILPGGEQIVVRAWPEDEEWRDRVTDLLEGGVPALADRIGLPWPVSGTLAVYEVHAPLLEGYAGFYDLDTDEITISEQLDDQTIVHEAAHAWFNDALFSDRWIYEGLAEEYASLVLADLGRPRGGPTFVTSSMDGAFPLATWPLPAPIRDDEAEEREAYGYAASWTIMRSLATRAGGEGMRAVFRASNERTIAYLGDVTPEPDLRPSDWRRFLDLLEEQGGVVGADALFRTWVVDGDGAMELDARAEAREAYAGLIEAGDGWLPPIAVRQPMATWRFDDAATAIDVAHAFLATRDAVWELARSNELVPPGGLEYAYESASTAGLAAAQSLVDAHHDALEEVIDAGTAVAAERDWLTQIGIDGTAPEDEVAAARTAWEEGDLTDARARAAAAAVLIAGAPEIGRTRALTVGGMIVAVFLVLGAVAVVARRRRAPGAAGVAGTGVPPGPAAVPAAEAPPAPAASQETPNPAPAAADAPGGYATLAGAPREPSPGEAPPAQEGGTSS